MPKPKLLFTLRIYESEYFVFTFERFFGLYKMKICVLILAIVFGEKFSRNPEDEIDGILEIQQELKTGLKRINLGNAYFC